MGHVWKKHMLPLAKKTFYTKAQSDAKYLGTKAKAADSEKLDGLDSTALGRVHSGSVNRPGGETLATDVVTIPELGSIRFKCVTGGSQVGFNWLTEGWYVFDNGSSTIAEYDDNEGTDVYPIADEDRVVFESVTKAAGPHWTITVSNVYGVGASDTCQIGYRAIRFDS